MGVAPERGSDDQFGPRPAEGAPISVSDRGERADGGDLPSCASVWVTEAMGKVEATNIMGF